VCFYAALNQSKEHTVLEFTTAVKDIEGDVEEEPIEYDLDGVLMTAYRPSGGQFAMLLAMTSKFSTDEEAVAGLVTMFVNIHDTEGQNHIANRLFDRKDPFDVDDIDRILRGLTEEWTARPTEPPSVSPSSPPPTGRKSTARTPARRTSSTSRRTAS
jgi:hypothetical protein